MADRQNLIICIFCLISWVTAQTSLNVCDNVDTTACTEMSNNYHDMCNDPCTRDVCQKHCGLCPNSISAPLTCYSCTGVQRLEDCHQVHICAGMNQSCIATQTVSLTFEIKYYLGCTDNQVCENLYHTAPSHKKRSIDLYGGCCNTDLCNKHVPSANPVIPSTQATVISNQHNTAGTIYSSFDIDQSICQRLFKTENDCQIPCNLKLCPQSCKQLTCYKCDYLDVNSIHLCTRTTTCSPGEECLISEVFDASYNPGYTLGCASKQVCDGLHLHNGNQTYNVNASDVTPNGACCKTSYCNRNHTLVQSTQSQIMTVNTSINHDSACFSHPCQNNHECHDHGDSYKCRCPHGFTGHLCDQPITRTCNCQNGGSCRHVGNTSTCVCPEGYFGSQCGQQCELTQKCQNGFINIPGLPNCYKFGNPFRNFTWEQARIRCNSICSNLLAINDHYEESVLSKYIQDHLVDSLHNNDQHQILRGSYFWLDATRLNAHSEFYWTSTGKRVVYTNWKNGHQHNNCIAFGPGEGVDDSKIHGYHWNSHNCTNNFFSACEHVPH